jgi:hypothetical protein
VQLGLDHCERRSLHKTAVFGLVQRHVSEGHSTVRVVVVPNTRRNELQVHFKQMDSLRG